MNNPQLIDNSERLLQVLREVLEPNQFSKVWPAKVDLDFISKNLVEHGAVILAVQGDKLWDAMLAGFIAPDLHSGELWAYEWLWVARPGSEPGSADLVRDTFEKVCKAQGCKRIVMGLFLGATKSDEKIRTRYHKAGYKILSESYIKAL